ncbi:DUF3027 domain-containing protein [Nocardia sp. NPDC050793]|uniref:DUF3027 domain-containing protein n=1 Tax=Nocardia sp. NPDC050793 TaxID=3155159 RepID=UPI0033F06551
MSAVSVSEPDVRPVLAEAVDLARRALLALEPSAVGAHLGVSAEDESAATHRFEATLPGYRGWQWAVVVAAPPGADHATVSESALLPGPDALVAPDFVPWEQRIRPGDLAPGDLLAPAHDDSRLVPGYVASGDPEVDEVALEIGLGRSKVLSEEGRVEAAARWYSEYGPDTDMAKAAPGTCGTCGFYLPLAGALRAAFGVCGNAMGADGRVVHSEYGCGAHSDVVAPTGSGSPLYEAFDDAAFDVIPPEELGQSSAVAAGGGGPSAPETESAETAAGEGVSAAAETETQVVDEESVTAPVDSVAEKTATIGTRADTEVGRDDVSLESPAEAPGVEQAEPVAETAAVAESTSALTHPEAIADATTVESAVAAAVDAEKGAEPADSVADEAVTSEQSSARGAAAEERPAADASATSEANVTGEALSLESSAAEPVSDEAPSLESAAAESVVGAASAVEPDAAESVIGESATPESGAAESVTGEASPLEISPAAESVTDAAPAAEPSAAESVIGEASSLESSPSAESVADATPAAESSVEAGEVRPSNSDEASATSESVAAEPVTGEVPSLSDDIDADAPAKDTAAEPGSEPDAQAGADDDGESRSESGSSPRN